MLRILFAALLVAASPVCAAERSAEPVRIMIVGSYHFGNPGSDINNAVIDPVTTPEKQAQLAAVAANLARFKPTAIAVERVASDPSTLRDQGFARFTPTALRSDPDERVQIAYRLAQVAGVDRVYAVDEQSDSRDYFPFGPVRAWAKEHGRSEELAALNAPVAAFVAELEARQKSETVGALLADVNRPDHPVFGTGSLSFYYGLMTFGDGKAQVGAALNAGWYERNGRIFSKIASVSRPGDRIVVVYGAGHNYWLRHFAASTPGFELVDSTPLLGGAD